MEHLSKFVQYLHRFCEQITMDPSNMSDPKNALILAVSLIVTIFSIWIAYFFTRRNTSRPPSETKTQVDSKQFSQTENVTGEDEQDDSAEGPQEESPKGCPMTWPCGPEDMAKIPPGCPLTHMYHISKMSQLTESQPQDHEVEADEETKSAIETDPQEYISHIQSQVKRSQQKATIKKIEADMDEEAKDHEREIQREQLEAIYKLMESQKDKFGINDVDDMQSQIKLYM